MESQTILDRKCHTEIEKMPDDAAPTSFRGRGSLFAKNSIREKGRSRNFRLQTLCEAEIDS
jgi:hypothetical protein